MDTIEIVLFALAVGAIGELMEYHRRACEMRVPCFGTGLKSFALVMLCALPIFQAFQQPRESPDMSATAAASAARTEQLKRLIDKQTANWARLDALTKRTEKVAADNADKSAELDRRLKAELAKTKPGE